MSTTTSSEQPSQVFHGRMRGLQHQSLRQTNQRAVLTVIGFHPGVSNADIARMSGLAPQTVSAILHDVEDAGLVMRGPVLRGRRGQPATPLYLAKDGGYAIGVEIGWRRLDVVMVNFWAEVVARRSAAYDFPDARQVPGTIVTLVNELIGELPTEMQPRLADVAITLPSRLNKIIAVSDAPGDQVRLWGEVDLAEVVHAGTGLEVSLVNDGNSACWAELIAHAHPRPNSFIYLFVSTFIAAGILGDGQLWEGPSNNSIDIGSMLVCMGDGTLRVAQRVASVSALARRLEEAGEPHDIAKIEHWDWALIEPIVTKWIDDSGRALASVAYNANTVLDASLIVVDSILPKRLTERLVAKIQAELAALVVVAYMPPKVVAGRVGASAPARGAGELVLFRRHFSRAVVEQQDVADRVHLS